MLIALIADVHANLEALEACLRHASSRGAERFAFLGDLVGYGADPAAVLDLVRDHVEKGAIAVQGNHDAAVLSGTRGLADDAHEAIAWTRSVLTDPQKAFLASLPLIVRDDDMCFVHASANAPERWEYVVTSAMARESIDAAATTWTFSGHVHEQVLYFKTLAGKTAPFRPTPGSPVPVPAHRGWLAIAGSAGQPRDGDPASAYALFDSTREEATFYRVPYDHLAAAAKIRAAALPETLAQRIEHGR